MAVNKLVDSTQLNADLTSVANAIRAKGGTSASLAFPAGFVSAIGDIPTGVRTDTDQGLNDTQKSTARGNIDAASVGEVSDLKSAFRTRIDYLDNHYDVVSNNLFNKATALFGKKVNATTGVVENSIADNFISQKIAVEPSTAYYANRNGCIYDSDGTFIEFHNISGGSNFTTPANASYIIITSTKSLIDASVVAKGSSVSYDDYKEAIKTSLVRTDNTLTEAAIPANAKATGDAIGTVKQDLTDSLRKLLNAVLVVNTVSGEIVSINNSAMDIYKSLDTEATTIYRSGTNIWDEEWELGSYDSSGKPSASNTSIRSKNDKPIPVKPNTDYYITATYNTAVYYYKSDGTFISTAVVAPSTTRVFTTPENAYFLRFRCVSNYGTVYNNDIQIAFNTDGEKQTYHANNTQLVTTLSELKLIVNSKNYIYAVGSDDNIEIEYYSSKDSGGKKPYESGFIVFSVPSRLTKSNNTVSANALSEGSDDSVDVNCILKLPTSYTPNGIPTKLIMICHGAGQSAQQWSTNANYNALVDAFVNAGYAVFDCNGYRENVLGYSFWGDSRGVDVWRKAYQYVVDNYNVEHQFGLYGFSMGGLTALNLMFSGFPGIKCVALGSPVVNLEACYNSESVNAVIKTLYGMGDTYNPALAYGCDPYSRIITISDNKYIFGRIPPLKMWYGSTETGTTDTGTGEVVTGVVVKAYGEDIVNAINRAGGQAEYREVANAGHEICYGGNSVVNADLVLYFNRHNKI